jgi:hypothetical protein
VITELLWHSRTTRALLYGLGIAVAAGGIVWLLADVPWWTICAIAVVAGAILGLASSWSSWQKWPGADDLSPRDRVEVVRSVRSGTPVAKPGLPPAVIDYAYLVQRSMEQKLSTVWVSWIIPGIWTIQAIEHTGQGLRSVVRWASALVLIALAVYMPRHWRRRRANAEKASAAASRARSGPAGED